MTIVTGLESRGYLVRHQGTAHKKRTSLEPSERLVALFPNPVEPCTVSRLPGAECITLNMNVGRSKRKKWIDYADTGQTREMRREMSVINHAIQSASITLHGKPQGPTHLVRMFLTDSAENERFDLHGRLYRGFWHNLPKVERFGLRLNGEPIIELDYSSMFTRLAYVEAAEEPPDGDLYEIPGLPREAVKTALSALLCHSRPMRRLPKDLKASLGKGWSGHRITAALAHAHPKISHLFGTRCGLRLMYLESQVLVSALLKLIDQGIVALPLHDGLL